MERVIGILIVAHGGLSQEYLAAVEHVVGASDGVDAVTVEYKHVRAEKEAEICAAAEAIDRGDGVVIVTDMFGSTPSNLCLKACASNKRKIVYGANLPLLIKLAKSRNLSIENAVDKALVAGRKYINCHDG